MSIESRYLGMDAVYWAPKGTHDEDGNPELATPTPIKSFWVDAHVERVLSDGTVVSRDALVLVSIDVQVGGWLWKGKLSHLQTTDPKTLDGAYEIKRFRRVVNRRQTKTVRVVEL